MKKMFVLVAILMAISLPALAVTVTFDWSSGDETGWSRWAAPWGDSNYAVTTAGPTLPEGTAFLNDGQTGSFGWYTVIPVKAGLEVSVDANWAGDINGAGWAEVMLYTSDNAGADWGGMADTGAAGDIAFKRDSWGMNPPTAWDWQLASLSPHPSGNGGTIISAGYVAVALKLGSGGGSPVWASWDDITVSYVPEPTSMLALASGLGVLGVIRRRR